MERFAIVEDDPAFRETLKRFISDLASETGRKYSLSVFSDGAELVKDYRPVYDVILMDIMMNDMNGMDAAKKVRETDPDVTIIFITSMSSYAIEGYSVGALDYLLKPLNYYAFSQCMERALARLNRREKRTKLLTHQKGVTRLSSDEILFVEIHAHSLIFHTTGGDLNTVGTMKEVEEELAGLPFYRCNKCDLVNLARVDGMSGDDALVGSYRVQLSRAKKKGFLEALNRYVNEVQA